MTATLTARPHAPLQPLRAADARWSSGFWHDVAERTHTVTVPSMWDMLRDPSISPGLTNFRIAAGLERGEHQGPPFMDGDFYKWFEAAVSQLEVHPDAELEHRLEVIARLIASVQREDGYIHTPTAISERHHEDVIALADRFNFETYNHGHLITAAVRHYQVTGSETLLTTAKGAARFLQTLAREKPRELARSAICPAHYMAVIELYRVTGDEQYLRLAEDFLRVRDEFDEGGDDNQDRIPVLEQATVTGHAVRANYLYAGLADLVAETGDVRLRAVLERLWHDVVDTKLYVTGGCGALYDGASPDGYPWQSEISRVHQAYGRPFQLPNTTAHNESCAQIGMIFWSERMLSLGADARYADVIEQITFNSLLSTIGLEGSTYFYTNPLRQVRDLPFPLRRAGDTGIDPSPAPPPSDARLRQTYLSCFCCPPNIARTLSRLHERIASVSTDGVFMHQYGGSGIRATVDEGRMLALDEQSDYPWDGRIVFTVREAAGSVPLHVRVPGWCTGATLTVNGDTVEVGAPSSYTRIDREWTAGDEIVLDLPMPVRLIRGHRLAEEVANQVAVQRGPIVYALESHDLPDDVVLEQAALRRDARPRPVEAEISGHRVIALDTELTVLPRPTEALYADIGDAPVRTIRARLIPYYAWSNRGPGEMSVWLPVVW